MTKSEVLIANKTARSKGSTVYDQNGQLKSIIVKYILNNIDCKQHILDFGCGPQAIQANYLNHNGFNVDCYDFGLNIPSNCVSIGLHNYDIVYASNVLNVQSNKNMLKSTLTQIKSCMKSNAKFICNFPSSPRKIQITIKELRQIINEIFKSESQIVDNNIIIVNYKGRICYNG